MNAKILSPNKTETNEINFNMLVADVETVDFVDIVDHHTVHCYQRMPPIYSYEIEKRHRRYKL